MTRIKRWLDKELAFFRDHAMIEPVPSKEITVLVGAGGHLYVQSTLWPHRNRQEQDLENANWLLRSAHVLAISAGAAIQVQNPPPATPATNPSADEGGAHV